MPDPVCETAPATAVFTSRIKGFASVGGSMICKYEIMQGIEGSFSLSRTINQGPSTKLECQELEYFFTTHVISLCNLLILEVGLSQNARYLVGH